MSWLYAPQPAADCFGTKHLLGLNTVCYVEQNLYRVEVLKARIRDGYLDNAPIWDDVRTFDGRPWFGLVDIISAGFPCQPYSGAGDKLGADDPRNLWPSIFQIICEVRPRYILLENVTNLLSFPYVGTISGQMAASGFDPLGTAYRLQPLARVKKGTGSGLLPTPTMSQDYKPLRRFCPAERKGEHGKGLVGVLGERNLEYLGYYLNPTFTERLMMSPMGWTDLKPLERDRFQEWLELHGIG